MATKPSNDIDATEPTRLQSARARTSQLAGQARDGAKQAAGNPAAVLATGFIAGAVLGVLIPVSRREKELLAPVGERISTVASDALQEATEQGRSKLNEVTGQFVTSLGGSIADAVGGKDS